MPNEHYTPDKIRGLYGHSEIDLKFPTPIPVNITYQTAFVDEAGKLQLRKDVYGRDAAMLALLKNSRSKDMENVVAHAQPSYARPTGNLPTGVNFASGILSLECYSFAIRRKPQGTVPIFRSRIPQALPVAADPVGGTHLAKSTRISPLCCK